MAVNPLAAPLVDDGLARLARNFGRALWPGRCLVCGEPGTNGRDLCLPCTLALPWIGPACRCCAMPLPVAAMATDATASQACGRCLQQPPPLAETRAACLYGFPVDRLLPRFKFHHDLAAGRLLAQLMGDAFGALPRPQALVPVPLHRTRLRQRGYDQALELARPLARSLQLPLLADGLRRPLYTAPQSRLDAMQRRRNLHGAFTVQTGKAWPAHVVLVDDVMTTGATLIAAATALRRAGVARVDAWVCARAP